MPSRKTRQLQDLREAVQEMRSIKGADHAEVQNALLDLARNCKRAGQLTEAKGILEEVVAIRTRLAGRDDYQTLKAESLLSAILFDMTDLEAAEPLQKHVLYTLERKFTDEDEAILQAKVNLANTLSTVGNHQAALRLDEEIVKSREVINGPNHPETMKSRATLARTLRAVGDADAAKALEREMLKSSTRNLLKRPRRS